MNNKTGNRILSALPEAEFAQVMPMLKPVALSAGQNLSEAGAGRRFVYFPETSVISCVASMEDGKCAEVAMVGLEGVADVSSLLGGRQPAQSLTVSIPGKALRASAEDFARVVFSGNGIQQQLLQYFATYVAHVSQRSACGVQNLATGAQTACSGQRSAAAAVTRAVISGQLAVASGQLAVGSV